MAAQPLKDPVIRIKELDAETLHIPIVGTAPLIMNNWSAKARKQMLDKMQGRKKVTEIRVPQDDYQASLYRIAKEPTKVRGNKTGPIEAYGFPVVAFKAATVDAARFYDKSVSMTALRQFLFFKGVMTKADSQELVEIFGEPDFSREDPVRVGMGTADLRYRAQFWPWAANLTVTFVRNSIDRDSVISLVDAGGMGIGVGEWRPQKSGTFGTYEVDRSKKIEVI